MPTPTIHSIDVFYDTSDDGDETSGIWLELSGVIAPAEPDVGYDSPYVTDYGYRPLDPDDVEAADFLATFTVTRPDLAAWHEENISLLLSEYGE